MVHAVANTNVPKFTVIFGGSFGAGNYGMAGGPTILGCCLCGQMPKFRLWAANRRHRAGNSQKRPIQGHGQRDAGRRN